MLSVEAINLTKEKINSSKITDSTKLIIQKLRSLKKFPFLKNIDLSIVFLEPEKIRVLNKKYRKKDKPTDILSFTIEKTKDKLTGEIILCPVVIKSKEYKVSNWTMSSPPQPLLTKEGKGVVKRLLTHGLLHLCGYDHRTEKEWKEMEKVARLVKSYTVSRLV